VDPATLPTVTVAPDVAEFDPTLGQADIQAILVTLAQNLEYENQAVLRNDPSILAAVDHGARLAEMQARVAAAAGGGERTLEHYTFEAIHVRRLVPFGVQSGLSLGLDGTGTLVREVYSANGALVSRASESFSTTFAVRRATGDRWLTIGVLAPAAAS
jgi:hypothetical protein